MWMVGWLLESPLERVAFWLLHPLHFAAGASLAAVLFLNSNAGRHASDDATAVPQLQLKPPQAAAVLSDRPARPFPRLGPCAALFF